MTIWDIWSKREEFYYQSEVWATLLKRNVFRKKSDKYYHFLPRQILKNLHSHAALLYKIRTSASKSSHLCTEKKYCCPTKLLLKQNWLFVEWDIVCREQYYSNFYWTLFKQKVSWAKQILFDQPRPPFLGPTNRIPNIVDSTKNCLA